MKCQKLKIFEYVRKKQSFFQTKSQITIFILLGLVIFIAFGFLVYVSYNLSQSKLEQSHERTRDILLTTTPIKYYVTSCLDESTEKALKLVGEQGGYIFNFQGGLIDWDIPYLKYSSINASYNVSYLIYRTNTTANNLNAEILKPYFYPCLAPSFFPCPIPYPCCNPCTARPALCSHCNFVGSACHIRYPNLGPGSYLDFGHMGEPSEKELNPDLFESYTQFEFHKNYTCGNDKLDNWHNNQQCNYSIQRQLEYYISKETEKCINLSLFKGYNLIAGNITTNVIFGIDDILVTMEYPLIIRQKNKPAVTGIFYFSLPPKKVRLYTIYEDAVKELIQDSETRYIAFNLAEEIENIDSNFIVTKVELPSSFDTIIIIEDTLSRLGVENYIFQFAIENRGPALDYVSSANNYASGSSCRISGEGYDVCVMANEIITLKPKGFDPDDDFLSYTYSGWKANNFTNSLLHTNGSVSEGCEPRRCASYKTNDGDIGERNIIVTISDGKYLDWQTIKIYVNDKPNPTLSTLSADGCKKADGSVQEWAAKANKDYEIKANCGDLSNPPFTFEWYIDSNPTPYKKIEPSCDTSYTYSLPAGTHYITLKVIDNAGAIGTIYQTFNVYDDLDNDGFCLGIPSCTPECGDCDDNNANINPGADDSSCDNVDNDCDDGFGRWDNNPSTGIDDDYPTGQTCGQINIDGDCRGTRQCTGGVESCTTGGVDCGLCVKCTSGINPICKVAYSAGTIDSIAPGQCLLPKSCDGSVRGCI